MSIATPPAMELQGSLFGSTQPRLQDLSHLERVQLDDSSWIDLGRDVVHGTDEVFAELRATLPWEMGTRPMYDRLVVVPRLTAFVPADDPSLPAIVPELAQAFSHHYAEDFAHVGANLYRDGNDSVAWHGDRVGRRILDPIVAIVSLGGSRVFRLRPAGGGPGRSIPLHSGDVLVMGGSCQHRWEHSVPKVRKAQPRMSLTFRHDHGPADRPVGPATHVTPVSV